MNLNKLKKMNNHCHSPNPKLIFHNSKCNQLFNHCNDISNDDSGLHVVISTGANLFITYSSL